MAHAAVLEAVVLLAANVVTLARQKILQTTTVLTPYINAAARNLALLRCRAVTPALQTTD
jgi:hypothetical protein